MSEQYQRFKQNFFRQHPLQANNNQEAANRSHKAYDPYGEYTSDGRDLYRQASNENLRIQNESHYPFEQIEQATFQEFQNDPFLSYKQNQNHTKGLEKSIGNANQNNNKNNYPTRNEAYEQEFMNYGVSSEYPDRQMPIRTESKLQYRTLAKQQQFSQQNQQAGIEKINQELDRLRINRQQNAQYQSGPSFQRGSQVQQRRVVQQGMRVMQQGMINRQNISRQPHPQQQFEINKQYLMQSNHNRANQPHLSPPKQLPVIYNRPNNSLTNSTHTSGNPQTLSPNNSRLTIQQSLPNHVNHPNHPNQNPMLLSPPPNPMQPMMITQPNQGYQQNIGSGSRVVVQSEIPGASKGLIPSIPNISSTPPLGYGMPPPQHVIVNGSTPMQIMQGQQRSVQQEGVVPLREYERLRAQTAQWQQKFYQANDQLTRVQSQRVNDPYLQSSLNQQTLRLKEQNSRLIQRIRVLQNNQRNSYEKVKGSHEQLMKKYQDSLMKECSLLIDRFRLEMKHNQRY